MKRLSSPRELSVGDKIVDNAEEVLISGRKPKLIEVRHIENYACSSYDTHVNHNACYAKCSPVWVI